MFYRLLSAVRRQRTSRGWQNWSSERSGTSAAEVRSVALPAQAQVVICGGGIMGTSVAYHLSKMGWKDIVLLEQGRLAAGSTRFCAGILSTARHLTIEQKMADYSNKLYQQLEQETGIQTEPLLGSLLRRMPDLETLEILKLVNCPKTFTPDMRCIMGKSPSVQGYFVLAGMNSAGLSFGGGAGKFSEEGKDSHGCQHLCPSGRGETKPESKGRSQLFTEGLKRRAQSPSLKRTPRGDSGSFRRKQEPAL